MTTDHGPSMWVPWAFGIGLGLALALGMVAVWLNSRGDETRTVLDQPNGCIVVVEKSNGAENQIDRWEPCAK